MKVAAARPVENSAPEVAIIGGGFTGMSAAYHLARRGIRAVVLEAERLGDGASGRTGGIVLEGTAKGIIEGADRCVPTLERLVREAGINCDLRLPGCWEIDHSDDAKDGALPWKDDGHGVRIVRTVAGGTVEPMALLVGLATAAVDAGAILHERARVRRLVVTPHPVLEVEGAVVRPRIAIVAVNAWTSYLLPGVRLVQSALTFACATEPLSDSVLHDIGLELGIPFYTVDTPYLWGRQTQDRRVIFGAGLSYRSPQELEQLELDPAEPATALARLEARVRRLHPALGNTPIAHRWAGPIGIPQGLVPLIGSLPRAPEILLAGGYAGHGVALSIRMGQYLAHHIVEGNPFPPWGAVSD
jgi:glycine/D-amino acid oxidase-like deaminating enzyme